MPRLAVIPMGQIGEVAVRIVAANLQAVLNLSVDVLDSEPIPVHTFRPERQQYDAGLVLEHLAREVDTRYRTVLGVVNVDLCIPILTHVFGEAQLGGRAAVISAFRLREDIHGLVVPRHRYYERLAKLALHEVAHTFSVYHCNGLRCLMLFSPTVEQLDEIELAFCEHCEFALQQGLKSIRGELE